MRNIFLYSLLAIVFFSCKNQVKKTEKDNKKIWVDSIYNQLSLEEKVGQLFMIRVYSNKNKSYTDSIKKLITTTHLGGIAFFQGGLVRQAHLTNQLQAISKVPLLIAIDAEWGLNMRLDSTFRYPYNMTLGAIENNTIIHQIGEQIGKHCKRMGIHLNFAPDVDINTNPKNPIIGVRSFGEDKNNVANKAVAFTNGLQSHKVLACAKHFPGHGDTKKDSHKTLPTISFSAKRIDSVELFPFKKVIENNIASIMVGHLNVPSLEPKDSLPSSLSYNIITKLLKETLAFKGLILTDALNMKGAANYKESGAIDLAAFNAGNDILLLSESIPKAMNKIIAAYHKGAITEDRLAHSVKKILRYKYQVNLHHFTPIATQNLIADLNTHKDSLLRKKAIEKAITTIKYQKNDLQNKKIGYLKLGDGNDRVFFKNLQKKSTIQRISEKGLHQEKLLQQYDVILISYHQENYRKIYPFSTKNKKIIETIAKNHPVILTVFASQYTVAPLSLKNIETCIIAYENSGVAQKVSAEIVLKSKKTFGHLPASINNEFPVNFGIIAKNTP